MADNTQLSVRVGDGDIAVTREISHGGDTAKLQGVFAMGISGNEGAYTAAAINGDATNGLDVDVTRVGGTVTVDGSGVTQPVSHAALTELAAAINASSQVDVNIAASNATVAVSNAGLTELAAAINASSQVDVNVAAGTVAVTHAALTELAAAINSNLVDVNIVSGGGSGGTAVADDADFTDGTTSLNPIGGVYESTPSTVTDGDIGMAGITETRALKVHVASGGVSGIVDDAAFTAGSSEGVLMMGVASGDSVDANDAGAIAMTTARAMHVAVQSIAAGNNNIGDVDIASLPASTNTLEVVGDVAHDAAAAGNPVQTGGYATNNIEGVTQVAAGDLTRTVHDLNGVQVVRPYTTLEEIVSARTSNTDGASTSLIAAGGSGVHTYITTVAIYNSSSTDGFVDLRDGTAGSVLFTLPAPQTGGSVVTFPVPLKFGDNTAVAFDASGAITTIYISVVGFQAQG